MTSDPFYFMGKAPLSKSLLNRAFIVKSWFPEFKIHGSSGCEDILIMTKLIEELKTLKKTADPSSHEFDCGLSGTAFRFFITRLSREKGEFIIKADSSLLERKLEESISFLSQLSVSAIKIKGGFRVVSKGWKIQGDGIYIPGQTTSQYASALLLNSWNLDKDIYFNFSLSSVSYPYFKMTLNLLKKLGMQIHQNREEFFIPKNQSLRKMSYAPEQDKSCLFALACFASMQGSAVFLDWEESSLQADHIFPEVLKKMGVSVSFHQAKFQESQDKDKFHDFYKKEKSIKTSKEEKSKISSFMFENSPVLLSSTKSLTPNQKEEQAKIKNSYLKVSKSNDLKSIDINLKSTPDLFPMLAVLCSKAKGKSYLRGISHLAFKESNRPKKIESLLKKCKINCGRQGDSFWIEGSPEWDQPISPFTFDPEKDHRIVMAVELLKSLKAPIKLTDKTPINKSFPDFYSCISK